MSLNKIFTFILLITIAISCSVNQKNKKQTIITFHFLPSTGIIQKLHVEMQLQSEGGVWKIVLQVYEESPSETATVQAVAKY